jgi:hypothetical protein
MNALLVTVLSISSAALGTMYSATASAAQPQHQPDFSGGWHVVTDAIPPLSRVINSPDTPFRPEALRSIKVAMAQMLSQGSKDYCRPYQFNGSGSYTNAFEDTVEFFIAPARITLLSELGMIRYIHLKPLVGDLLPEFSDSGYSRGRWEGDTLVVETTQLDPKARFPMPMAGAPAIGNNVKVVERFHLEDADTMVVRTVTVAPDLLTRPLDITARYTRIHDYVPIPISFCVEGDRLTEEGSGRARFDLTPPPGVK